MCIHEHHTFCIRSERSVDCRLKRGGWGGDGSWGTGLILEEDVCRGC